MDGSKLSKKLIELKEALNKANKLANKLKRAEAIKYLRRRGSTTKAIDTPTEKQIKDRTAQIEMEGKIRSDKTFRDAALQSNKATTEAQKKKTALTQQQNKGYDKAVEDESGTAETVGTKKRGDKYINQMSRRKEAGINKLIDKQTKMGKTLREKLEEFKKGMSQAGLGGAGSVKAGAVLPSINTLPKPGNNSLAGKTGIPGMKQSSIKNPVKAAQQIHNKDIKDIKMKEAQAALKGPQMTKEEFPFRGAFSHEEKAKQLNEVYDKHKTLYDKASNPTDKKYHSGNLDTIQSKIQQHAQLKKDEHEQSVIKFDSNGQWSMQKGSSDPKLAPKDVKVKELQSKIDAGTYKPDASKIADKMLPAPKK